jgi:hypothetical protein
MGLKVINLPGIIQVLLPDTPFAEVERCREIIHALFESDFFKIKNGKAVISFNQEGTIQQIGADIISWKRGSGLQSLLPRDKIEVVAKPNTLTHTLSGAAK